MPTKTWKAEFEGVRVEFINSWSFSLRCTETLLVNGEVVSEEDKNEKEDFKSMVSGVHRVTRQYGGKEYRIEVKVGSKWPGFFIGCHIYINEKLVGGDVNSKLMFT